MTADTTDLTERIARTIYEAYEGEWLTHRAHPGWDGEDSDTRRDYFRQAAAVLPIIAAEVQAAKAEALREAERTLERGWPHKLGINLPPEDYDHAGDHAMETAQEYLKRRATEYETGDRA